MEEMQQTEKQTRRDEAVYGKISDLVSRTITTLPNSTRLFRSGLKPEYANAIKKLSQKGYELFEDLRKEDATKIKDYETKTTDLTTKLDSALAEKQKLEATNTSSQTEISELEKGLGEAQKKYELFRKAILLQFSDEELENTLYQREEENIKQAEAEDAATGMEKNGI